MKNFVKNLHLGNSDEQDFLDNIEEYPFYILCAKCNTVTMFKSTRHPSYTDKICPTCKIQELNNFDSKRV